MIKYLAFISAFAAASPALAAAPYIYTPLADSTGPFATFQNAAINNNGLVAFKATLDNSSSGIYVASQSLAPAAVSLKGDAVAGNGTITGFATDLDVNDSGLVVFGASTSTSVTITALRSTSSPLTLLTTTGSSISGAAINNSGFASFVNAGHDTTITVSNGTTSNNIATTGGTLLLLNGLGITSINNNGAVAFLGAVGSNEAVLSNASGTVSSLVDASGAFNTFSGVAENSTGVVAFSATMDDKSHGVFTVDPLGNLTTIVPTTATFKSFTGSPSINDSGKVLFFANDANNVSGLFTGPDQIADKVLGVGDPLFGSSVSSLFVLNEGLNNSGQVAFRANLANGINYIVLATPATPGDANADGHVDLTDLSTVLNNFGNTTPNWTAGNFDGAPTIDLTDLSDVLNNFGASNPGLSNAAPALTAAPEPTTFCSLALPAILLFRTRRSQRCAVLSTGRES